MRLKTVTLLLPIAGALFPFVFFTRQLPTTGFGFVDFVRQVFANPAAGEFSSDWPISSLAF